jgi:hypothetical protein
MDRWGDAERQNAFLIYQEMVKLGGERLVGRASSLDPKVFWPVETGRQAP